MTAYKSTQTLDKEAIDIMVDLNLPEGLADLKVKDRAAIPQQEMPLQEATVRSGNMEEVALGYTENQVIVEASRCLQCKIAPCIKGCPVNIEIPGFIGAVARGNFDEAL